eukprot:TRINITY_DN44617_c0_g1_i2.p1 TRINITY_DN44617_c0_g1~~TRINITY_DN44617_c0_g1_i2.p1  ORF type:complete len:560 (-),score=102.17 TRINITY_DN44617_c0_g1_i2:265-1944(-)
MASLSSIPPLQMLRWQSSWPIFLKPNLIQLRGLVLQNLGIRALPKKGIVKSGAQDSSDEGTTSVEKPKSSKRAPRRSKKVGSETLVDKDVLQVVSDVASNERTVEMVSDVDSKQVQRKSRKKDAEGTVKKIRRTRKKMDIMKGEESGSEELGDIEELNSIENVEHKNGSLQFEHDGEDISFTYAWPPLVCFFGAAHYSFIPSGRPANRLIDHEMHKLTKDMLWAPTKFVRAPGTSSFSVALALAAVGGRVAFMGKLGDDEYGQALLYHLNVNNVQTRSVKVDGSKRTAISFMKISKRGGLRMTCIRPSAEDSLKSSEINIDVLKEAKMFYFNSSSLLDQNMRSTTMQTIKISKKFGGVIFFDLNLPLPLWQSSEETKAFIHEAWNSADFIEVTKQELEFLCGIESSEKFDTKDNDKSKFVHYKPDIIRPLWHENLKVLFVTNGTSKIHYYTEKDNGAMLGMEDAPITPFTCDMSASGDAVVAALMRMLTVQPHLVTDRGYLRHMIKYALSCGVIDQWIHARARGFPPKGEIGDVSSEADGIIRSITEREYRTVEPVSSQ